MLEVILAQYGLIAVFLGTFLEGEIVVIAGGLLSRLGFLDLSFVLPTVFLATFLGDLFFFYMGRNHGNAFLNKRPHIKVRSERIRGLVHEHHNKILFGYRFLYGLRIPTLLALGTSELSTKKFVFINILNSVIWSLLFCFGGYFFGDIFTLFVDNVKSYEKEVFMGLGIIAVIVWLVTIIKNKEEYN